MNGLIWIYKMIWKEWFTFYIDEELEKYFVVEDEDLDIELEFVLNYFGTYQNKQKLWNIG
jgi:hypothetical protein